MKTTRNHWNGRWAQHKCMINSLKILLHEYDPCLPERSWFLKQCIMANIIMQYHIVFTYWSQHWNRQMNEYIKCIKFVLRTKKKKKKKRENPDEESMVGNKMQSIPSYPGSPKMNSMKLFHSPNSTYILCKQPQNLHLGSGTHSKVAFCFPWFLKRQPIFLHEEKKFFLKIALYNVL